MTFDLSSFAELFKGLGSSLGGKVTGDLGTPADWKLEAIQDGDTAYIHFPLIAKQLPPGKTWIKGDAKELSQADAGRLSQFGSFAGTDPRDVFGLLKAVSGSIEAVGTEKIRGVETSHYRATIDTAEARAARPGRAAPEPRRARSDREQAGLTELPLDVWIDADQRVRKLSIDLDAKQPGTDARVEASLVDRALRLRHAARARAAAGRRGRRRGDAEEAPVLVGWPAVRVERRETPHW